jgi:ABC-type Na+ efflux pump permease subunit
MAVVCVGALLPWTEPGRSGILGDGRYALVLAAIGLTLYALAGMKRLDHRWWRVSSVPLTLGCLAVSAVALKGHGALGAIVTAVAAVAWLAISRPDRSDP